MRYTNRQTERERYTETDSERERDRDREKDRDICRDRARGRGGERVGFLRLSLSLTHTLTLGLANVSQILPVFSLRLTRGFPARLLWSAILVKSLRSFYTGLHTQNHVRPFELDFRDSARHKRPFVRVSEARSWSHWLVFVNIWR